MVSRGLVLLLIFCFCSANLFGRTVRVATYNLGNYLIGDRWVEGRYVKMYPKPEIEKEALRDIIRRVKPDILVMQEMGGELFLKELQADLKKEGEDYPHRYLGQGPDDTRCMAVLSKEPFVEAVMHSGLEYRFLNKNAAVRRGLLELRFKTEGVEWGLFGVHLKSRRWNKPQDYESLKQRIGEATAIRDKIKARYPDLSKAYYLILGDFNDNPKSKALGRFLKMGQTRLAVPLPAEDSRGEVWTHYREGYGVYSQIDFLLVSPPLLERVKFKKGWVADGENALKASDHRMVYGDVVF